MQYLHLVTCTLNQGCTRPYVPCAPGTFVLSPAFWRDSSGNFLQELCVPLPNLSFPKCLCAMLGNATQKEGSGAEQHVAHHAGKEYAKADSRYARRESCVLSIEGVTAAVLGPLSFVVMYGIAARQPWRHTLAMLVSMGQLWGDVLYFLSAHLEGGQSQQHLL